MRYDNEEDYGQPLDTASTALWLLAMIGGIIVWAGVALYFLQG